MFDFLKKPTNEPEEEQSTPSFETKTVFEDDDGTSKVVVVKDPNTGKFTVNVLGDNIDIKNFGKLHVVGSIKTDLSVKGDIEVTGNIDSCHVVATGNVHCSGVECNGAKIERYAVRDELEEGKYDIEINAGTVTFNGSICGLPYRSNSLSTGDRVLIGNNSRVRLNRNLTIGTDNEIALYLRGNLTVSKGVTLKAMSFNSDGIGIDCYADSYRPSLYIEPKATVECFGTRYCFDNGYFSTVTVHGNFIADGGNYGLMNRGMFRVWGDSSKVKFGGKTYGVENHYDTSTFIAEANSRITSEGGRWFGSGFHNLYDGTLIIKNGAFFLCSGGISYTMPTKATWATVDGELSIYRNNKEENEVIRAEDNEVLFGRKEDGHFSKENFPFAGNGMIRYNTRVIRNFGYIFD